MDPGSYGELGDAGRAASVRESSSHLRGGVVHEPGPLRGLGPGAHREVEPSTRVRVSQDQRNGGPGKAGPLEGVTGNRSMFSVRGHVTKRDGRGGANAWLPCCHAAERQRDSQCDRGRDTPPVTIGDQCPVTSDVDRSPPKSDQQGLERLLGIGVFMWRYGVDEWLMRGRQKRVSLLP